MEGKTSEGLIPRGEKKDYRKLMTPEMERNSFPWG